MFITFEGIEGSGKTTQVKNLAGLLRTRGISFLETFEPGGTPVGREVRRILLDSRNVNLVALAELFLYSADRAQHVEEVIEPALKQGKWVLCDRFYDATTVYQGYARGQDLELIRELNSRASRGIRPDMTFLLDCPVEIGIERALERNDEWKQVGQDRFEREARTFHEAVRKGYLALAKRERDRFLVLDATLPESELSSKIREKIEPYLSAKMGR